MAGRKRKRQSTTPTVDLHGYTIQEAIDALPGLLKAQQRIDADVEIQIIFGIGMHSEKGPVLREAVMKWLQSKSARSLIKSPQDMVHEPVAEYLIKPESGSMVCILKPMKD